MKVAITSTDNSLTAKLDSRFGRCSFFAIYDTESQGIEFIPNPNKEAVEGAGPAAVQLVASKRAKKLVSGEFGNKVKNLTDSLQIQLVMINDQEKTIQDIIDLLKQS